MRVFADRADAGRQLAERLGHLRGQDAVVLGLPRGGVPVAFQVAVALQAPLAPGIGPIASASRRSECWRRQWPVPDMPSLRLTSRRLAPAIIKRRFDGSR
jgi:hypothetical protein